MIIYKHKTQKNFFQTFPIPDNLDDFDILEVESIEDIEEEPPTYNELYEMCIQSRKEAYKEEADSLYQEWQYDKTDETEQIWRDKVLEIKERYPKPIE